MSIDIALSGSTVWPVSNPLASEWTSFHRRFTDDIFRTSTASWSGEPGTLAQHVEDTAAAMLIDIMTTATALHYRRHAARLEREVGSELGDELADALRARARVIELYGVDGLADEVADVLAELEARDQDEQVAA